MTEPSEDDRKRAEKFTSDPIFADDRIEWRDVLAREFATVRGEARQQAIEKAYREGFIDAVNDESAHASGSFRKDVDQCWLESDTANGRHRRRALSPPLAEDKP